MPTDPGPTDAGLDEPVAEIDRRAFRAAIRRAFLIQSLVIVAATAAIVGIATALD